MSAQTAQTAKSAKSGRSQTMSALHDVSVAAREVAELERLLDKRRARRDDLIRKARASEPRVTVAQLQEASRLSRPRVNQIISGPR